MSSFKKELYTMVYRLPMLPITYTKHTSALLGHLYTPYMTPGAKRASDGPHPQASKTSNVAKRERFLATA